MLGPEVERSLCVLVAEHRIAVSAGAFSSSQRGQSPSSPSSPFLPARSARSGSTAISPRGPSFNPTSDTFLVAVQHPGDAGLATFDNPATRWPDFKDDMPVRPAVIAITKQGGGKVG